MQSTHGPVVGSITVIGARGGAGSSTLALAIARQLRDSGSAVRLVDEGPWEDLVRDAASLQALEPDHLINVQSRHLRVEATDQVLLLVPAEVRAIANAAALLTELERHAPCSLVVRVPGPTRIAAKKIERLLQIPLLAVIKDERKLAVLNEHGASTSPALKKSVRALLSGLAL